MRILPSFFSVLDVRLGAFLEGNRGRIVRRGGNVREAEKGRADDEACGPAGHKTGHRAFLPLSALAGRGVPLQGRVGRPIAAAQTMPSPCSSRRSEGRNDLHPTLLEAVPITFLDFWYLIYQRL